MSIDWICTRKSAARMPSFSLFPRPREPIPPHHLVLSSVSSSVITPPDSLSMPNSNGFLINDSRVSLQLSCGETARVEHTNGNSSPLGETTRQRPHTGATSPTPVASSGPSERSTPANDPTRSPQRELVSMPPVRYVASILYYPPTLHPKRSDHLRANGHCHRSLWIFPENQTRESEVVRP